MITVMKTFLVRGIPEDVLRAFRLMCVEKDTSANKVIVRLMEAAVKEYEKKKKARK